MGISGLLPFVKNACRPANLRDFSGSTVAIDGYSWLHKGAFSCAEKLVKGEKTDGYIFYCIKYLNLIIEAGLKPIMVFDGCNLPSKAVTEKKRRENREKKRQRGKELLCEGKIKEARECFQSCVDVTPEMAREVILACKRKSIDCIVAPYEADSQLAYLAKNGIAQLIITEDSDLILFECDRILFKMDIGGGGLLFERENLSKCFGSRSLKFSFEKFRYMCILSGCDYLPSLPGIGLGKAFKFFSLTTNSDLPSVLPKLPSYLKMPRLTVPKEYIESFIKAYNTFLYQLVFCPKTKKLVPLHPYPENVSPNDMEYAGKYLPDDVACQLAMGNINVNTMEEFTDSQNVSSVWDDTSSVWGSQQSQRDSKALKKMAVSAFEFGTHKRKSLSLPKCAKNESGSVGETGDDKCTNEELFAMYKVQDSTKNAIEVESSEDEQDILDKNDEVCESPTTSDPSRVLNNPFRKIVRSRFFVADQQSSKEEKISQEEKESNSLSAADSTPSKYGSTEGDCNDDCNFSLDLKVESPVKENKENIRNRFAKRKIPTLKEESPSKKLKSSALIDIIDDENDASTSTVSSSGLATKIITATENEFVKPASPKNFFNSRKKLKRFRTTKISSFDWKNITNSKPKLNSSLGSDGNSGDESFEAELKSGEVEKELSSPILSGETSPFFSTTVSSFDIASSSSSVEEDEKPAEPFSSSPVSTLESLNGSSSVDKNEPVEANSSEISILYCSPVEEISKEQATVGKVLKSIDNKRKTGKCRTIGLSKKKSLSKLSMKETLMNFNFIRQPKKELSGTT